MKPAVSVRIRAVALLAAASAASAQDFTAGTPDSTIAVEPGQSVDIPVVIANNEDFDSPVLHLVLTASEGSYTFEERSLPECGPIGPSTERPDWTESAIAPIPAHETRTCTIRATRDPGEIDNGFMDWFIRENGASFFSFEIGTFVDIAVSATKIGSYRTPDGMTHATYRIEADNTSTIDAENVTIQLGPACVQPSVFVDTDGGGCAPGHLDCGFGGADPAAAMLPRVAAGSSASCVVRFTALPGADLSQNVAALFGGAIQNANTGGLMADDNPDNDTAPLDLQPQQRGHSVHMAPRPRVAQVPPMPR
jgi:hypothetical protein